MDAVWRRILGNFRLYIDDYPIETGQRADPRAANGIHGWGHLGVGLYRFYSPAAGRRTFRLGCHLKILTPRLCALRRVRALCYAQSTETSPDEITLLISGEKRLNTLFESILDEMCAVSFFFKNSFTQIRFWVVNIK